MEKTLERQLYDELCELEKLNKKVKEFLDKEKNKEMELKYGRTETYKYNLDKERLNWLTDRTNRSNGQTQFLFQLVDGDFEKLKFLEMQLKNCFVGYCPGSKKDVERILSLEPKCDMLIL